MTDRPHVLVTGGAGFIGSFVVDLLCRAYHVTYGLEVTVVRGTNAYGPRQHPEKAIPTFTLAALEGRPVPVYGDGSNRREWLFARDFAAAVLSVLEDGEPGHVY